MAVAKITGEGLSAIAVLVVLLWGCLVGEHLIVRRANLEVRRVLHQVRLLRMKRQVVPVSAPRHMLPPRPSLG